MIKYNKELFKVALNSCTGRKIRQNEEGIMSSIVYGVLNGLDSFTPFKHEKNGGNEHG